MPAALGLSSWRWSNNIKSMLLLLAFPLLLLGLLGGVFFAAGWLNLDAHGAVDPRFLMAMGFATTARTPLDLATQAVWDYWPIVLGIAAVWTLLGYLFNDAMIRAATGAKPIERSEAPKLYNLFENLCISRGLTMPRLYLIDTGVMNAYASGIDEASYSVTVTRGLVERLDDAEIEAVLAHELTHIINRDVRLLVVAIVFTGMLSFVAQMMWRSMRFASHGRQSSRGGGKGALVLMLIAAVMMTVGYGLAVMLRLALSRRREYLADAGAVALTKNPEALIAALQKISGNADLPDVPAEVRQMFIENPPSFFALFDTHPPIQERIRVLRAIGGVPPEGDSVIPRAGRA